MISDWLPIIFALLVTGTIAGVLAGLLGVGGGIVIVPVLFLIFQSLGMSLSSSMPVATATSLMTIVPTSMSSSYAHHRKGNVDWQIVRTWCPTLFIGVIAGSLLASNLGGLFLSRVFGCIAILVALNMLLRANAAPLKNQLPGAFLQSCLSALLGFFSVLMGIGGGTLGVPTMTAFNTPTHRAVGTSAFLGLLIALPSSLILLLTSTTPGDAPAGTVGLVNLPGFLIILPMTILMAPVGVKLGSKLNGLTLKKLFAAFLILVGLRMLWQSFT